MRTTLDIADDVLQAARERARRERKSIGEVVSELARRSLNARPVASPAVDSKPLYGFEPFAPRGGLITNDLINQMREDDPG
jgi:hypothetical protein